MTRFALWNFVAQEDRPALEKRLAGEGCALREIDTTGVRSPEDLWAAAGRALGFDPPHNWTAFADLLGGAFCQTTARETGRRWSGSMPALYSTVPSAPS